MRSTLLCILLLLFQNNLKSQDFVITKTGDTVRGSIKINTKEILVENNQVVKTFNTEDIAKVMINKKERFPLRLVLLGYTDDIETVKNPNYTDPVYDTTILLKLILEGPKMNMYTAKDKRGVDYYFVKRPEDKEAIQLLYKVGGEMPDKLNWAKRYQYVNYITKFNIFSDQLNELMADCDDITWNELNNLIYMEFSIKKIVKKYNKKCL